MELQWNQKLQRYFFFCVCVFTYLLQCGQSHVLLHFHTHQVVCLSFLSSRLPPGGLHRRLKQFLLKTTFTTFTWIGYISPSNHYFSNMTKILTLPEKEGGSKFCFSFHIVNIWREGLIREVFPIWFSRKLLNELFPDAEALQNCLFFSFPWKLCCPKVFCQNKNYCSQENRLSIRPHDEEYLISKMDLKACLKYSWTEIAIPNSWLGRELFKAIPVYLFLTALIEPCLHDMCRCLLSSHLFMFDMCRCLFGS